MTYSEIVYLRQVLTRPEGHSWDQYAGLAGNVLSPNDIAILRSSLHRSENVTAGTRCEVASKQYEGDNAGRAALALLTRAAYGDIACDIRPWLLGFQDPGDEIYTAAPHALALSVKEFADGDALRFCPSLLIRRTATWRRIFRALSHCGDNVQSLLTMSRRQRVASLLPGRAGRADNRQLWSLKTFLDDERVVEWLETAACSGRLYALLGLICQVNPLNWILFDSIQISSRDDAQMFVNAMVENVSRGADASYCIGAAPLRGWNMEIELAQGLALVGALS